MQRLGEGLIVPAGPGDAEALARVHVTAWRETYTGLLPAHALAAMDVRRHAKRFRAQLLYPPRNSLVLALEQRGGLVGYGEAIGGGNGTGEVHTLYLLRAAQGVGLGREMLAALARALAGGGARSTVIWVLSTNVRARAFYEHLGGHAGPSRPVAGWGPGLMETRYEWPDIARLAEMI